MYQKANPLFLIAESPLHAGSGSDLGDIDLPIQRESHTGHPKVEASSLKGALRHAFEAQVSHPDFTNDNPKFDLDHIKLHRVFGYDDAPYKPEEKAKLKEVFKDKNGNDQTDFAGCLGFTDARILLFPVKSLKGTFAWITCPSVLKRFKNEMGSVCQSTFTFTDLHGNEETYPKVTNKSVLTIDSKDTIQLEEYIYENVGKNDNINKLAKWLKSYALQNTFFKEKILENLVILPDDDFNDFVKLSTEVVTRTKISNETGTVDQGALFTEEYLPAETVMYSLAMFSNEFRKENGLKATDNNGSVESFFMQHLPSHFQLGANTTLGKGIINAHYLNDQNTEPYE